MTLEARVAGFLVFNESRDFCDACIAAALGTSADEVRASVLALRRRFSIVLRDRWVCEECGKHGDVTRAVGGRTVARKGTLRRRAFRMAWSL